MKKTATSFLLLSFLLLSQFQPVRSQVRTGSPISAEVMLETMKNKSSRPSAERKQTTALLEMKAQLKKDGVTKSNAAARNVVNAYSDENGVQVDAAARVFALVKVANEKTDEVAAFIQSLGGTVTGKNATFGIMDAWIAADDLDAVASLGAVKNIQPNYKPRKNIGSVTTRGDTTMRSDIARSFFGINGSNIKIGVMSDGCDGLANAQSLGDLPTGARFQVVDNSATTGTASEGTAMAEIVYDLVPGCNLAFATAFTGLTNFVNNINALAAAGCDVITDDIIYFLEPVFEDGPLSQTIDTYASNGGIYTSSSNNQGEDNYRGTYANIVGLLPSPVGNANVHNFGGGDFQQSVTLGAGENVRIVLHWDDQYAASANDFDLLLLNAAGTAFLATSEGSQDGTQDPTEIFSYTAPVGATVNVVIRRFAAATNVTPRLKLSYYFSGSGSVAEFNSGQVGAAYGHTTAIGCLSAGAIWASVAGYSTIEPFSNGGPATIVTDFASATRPRPATTRTKPDVASFDGVSVTGSAGFPSTFFGTSAATPHVAGLAALVLCLDSTLNGARSLSAAQVRNLIRNGAMDYGASGTDNIFGFGRTDALNTLFQVRAATGNWTTVSNSPILTIPDNNVSGVSSTISISGVPAPNACEEVYVSVTIDHNNINQLRATLTSPDGTTRSLFAQPGSAANNPNVLFSDNGTSGAIQSITTNGALEVFGYYTPNQLIFRLSAFRGRPVNGTWTLNVADVTPVVIGALRNWSLLIRRLNAPTAIQNVAGSSISGGATIQFNSPNETAADIVFTSPNATGNMAVARYDASPQNSSGVSGNTSTYRWEMQNYDGFSFTNANVRFNYTQFPSGVTTPTSVTLYSRPAFGTGAFSALTTTLVGAELRANVTGFSEFVFGSGDNPLPVNLQQFTATARAQRINLNWETASEQDNAGFIISRSESETDGYVEIASHHTQQRLRGRGTTVQAARYQFSDNITQAGKTYFYKLEDESLNGTRTTLGIRSAMIPVQFALDQNYPNPFNPSTDIRYQVSEVSDVRLEVFDVLGRKVSTLVNERQPAGNYAVNFKASGLSSGVYYYRLDARSSGSGANSFMAVRKMMLMK
jgi:subtilisin-like proprotein convertase family protein